MKGMLLMSNNKNVLPENMEKFFNARVDGYDDHMKENIDQFEDFYKIVAKPIKENQEQLEILDLGCGTGLELEHIFSKVRNAHITGIDLSQEMLNKLLKKYDKFSNQITLIRDSYTSHDLGEEKYDYAVSVMTIHHLFEDEKVDLYSKIRDSLKNDGMYIEGDYVVTEEEAREALEEYERKIKLVDRDGFYHIDIPMTEETQVKLLKKAGFSEVEVIFRAESNRVFVARK